MRQFKYIGRIIFALAFLMFGVSHFSMTEYFGSMVPGFIPFPIFWTYFVGIAFILVAVSVLFDVMAPLACILLGVLMFIIAFSVHLLELPAGGSHLSAHWFGFVQAIAVGAAAWYMAGVFASSESMD